MSELNTCQGCECHLSVTEPEPGTYVVSGVPVTEISPGTYELSCTSGAEVQPGVYEIGA